MSAAGRLNNERLWEMSRAIASTRVNGAEQLVCYLLSAVAGAVSTRKIITISTRFYPAPGR
jgi:hypothetical protein